jgi:chaperonin cofactor prefoldin
MWPFANKEHKELKEQLESILHTSVASLSLSSRSLDRALEELHQALREKKAQRHDQ